MLLRCLCRRNLDKDPHGQSNMVAQLHILHQPLPLEYNSRYCMEEEVLVCVCLFVHVDSHHSATLATSLGRPWKPPLSSRLLRRRLSGDELVTKCWLCLVQLHFVSFFFLPSELLFPCQSWESLDFQVNFTIKATNVLFGYWSHDLGGHKTPCPSPELYTRQACSRAC